MAHRSLTAGFAVLLSAWASGLGGDAGGDAYAAARAAPGSPARCWRSGSSR